MKKYRIAACQNKVTADVGLNRKRAVELIAEAAGEGAKLAALPEIFTSPYTVKAMAANRERIPGPTSEILAEAAAKHGIYVLGGSIPEETEDGSVYNSAMLIDPSGKIIANHRKAHLFDVDISGKVGFQESRLFKPGNEATVVETTLGNIGIAICYDIRFPEFFRTLALKGAEILLVPGAFGTHTGQAHWVMSIRMRAMENQCYLAGISPAPNPELPYIAYGHSAVAGPWGELLGELGEEEGILYAEIDRDEIKRVRGEFPLLKNRRPELYRI